MGPAKTLSAPHVKPLIRGVTLVFLFVKASLGDSEILLSRENTEGTASRFSRADFIVETGFACTCRLGDTSLTCFCRFGDVALHSSDKLCSRHLISREFVKCDFTATVGAVGAAAVQP